MTHLNGIMIYVKHINGTFMTETTKNAIEKLILDSYIAGETS